MSQRDDELLTLLRAELAHRDTTPPREGFDMRMHQAVRELQRPRGQGHRLFASGLALATVASIAVGLAVGLRAHRNGGVAPAGPVHTTVPSAAPVDLHVLMAAGATGSNATADSVRFVRGDGTLVRTVPFPEGPFSSHQFLVAAGGQLFYYYSAQGQSELKSLDANGKVHDHGPLPIDSAATAVGSMVVRPDGGAWAWTVWERRQSGSTESVLTRLYLGGPGRAPRLLFQESIPVVANVSGEVVDDALAWNDHGIVIGGQAVGIGGFIPFSDWSRPRVIDPGTGAVRTLGGCQAFASMAEDGGWVCLGQPGTDTITVYDALGHLRRRIIVPGPVSDYGGAVESWDGRMLAYGVLETGCNNGSDPCRWRTDVVDIVSGRITHPAPAGYTPAGWLQDGSLVVFSRDSSGAANEPASTVEAISAGGRLTPIGPGDWVGATRS